MDALARLSRPTLLFVILLSAGIGSAPVAAGEVCEYTLYSVWTQTSMPVCELPIGQQACGAYLKPETAKERNAMASGNISKTAERCSNQDNIIGVCVLATTRLAFFEGDPGILEIGCANMEGSWRTLSIADKRDPQVLKNLQ